MNRVGFFLLLVLTFLGIGKVQGKTCYLSSEDRVQLKALSREFISCIKSNKYSQFKSIFLDFDGYLEVTQKPEYRNEREYLVEVIDKSWKKLQSQKISKSKLKFIRNSFPRKANTIRLRSDKKKTGIVIKEVYIVYFTGGEIRKQEISAFIKVGKSWHIFIR